MYSAEVPWFWHLSMGFTVRVTLVVEGEGASRDTRGRHGSELDRGTGATTCRGSCRVEEEHGITVCQQLANASWLPF